MPDTNLENKTPAVNPPVTVTPPAQEPAPQQTEGKFTQADVDRIVSERLKREKEHAAELERKAKEKAEADALAKNQEWEKLAQQRADELAKAQAALEDLKLDSLKRDIASEIGLPPALALRLVGKTKEEITADAKALAETLPKKQPPVLNPTYPGGPTGGETDAERRKRLLS